MGSVLKGRDPDLGRDVAIKVVREDLRDNGDLVRRFVEEAQIGGQLQHPGVVPIYELGTFADKRPYFSMKLVKGQTLADLLAARSGPADDLPRFMSIFAAVAQTMAYSHTRGVIHRDLKPSNVMVGSFGEVQVMDWGLAKVLPRGGLAADAHAGKELPPETLIATARSGSDAGLSHAGSVLGTPSYMAPEQARGENELINERADVFALGSILGEILTGSPAFTGRGSGEVLRKAGRGDTVDALARLDGCGAERELIAIAKDCLAVEPEHRPRDANVVSERITVYLAGVQERVQAAERERAVAVARAIEERRRRKVQLALAASVLAFTTLGGLSTTYYLQQRAERARQETAQAAAVDRVVGQAETLRDQAKANPEDVSRWEVALAAVEQAEAVRDEAARPRLLDLHREIQAGLDAAGRDKILLDRLVDIRSAEADDPDGSITDHDYAEAFREAGIEFAGLAPAEAGAKIKARPASVSLSLAAALDDWAAARRYARNDAAGATQLSEAARVADPDPWRNELRKALDQSDKAVRLAGLQALAKTAKFDELGAISLHLLGTGLIGAGESALAESVLRTAQDRHPGDVWVNRALAAVLEKLSRRDEAIRFYTAARSIRPETAHSLAHALEARGASDEALSVFRDLNRLRPGNGQHLGCLGRALKAKGLSGEADETLEAAAAAWRSVIRLKPDDANAHHRLGDALLDQGKLDEAIAELQAAAIRLKPDDALAHRCLGHALQRQGKPDQAIVEFRAAIQLAPDDPSSHYKLGDALSGQCNLDEAVAELRTAVRLKSDEADFHKCLGNALRNQGKHDEAIAAYREAIRYKPDDSEAHNRLGSFLGEGKQDHAAAEAAFREAIRYKPDSSEAHNNLGIALKNQGKHDEAIAAYREAIRLKPGNTEAHIDLGALLCDVKREYPAAEAAFREAIRLRPDFAWAHSNLGNALGNQGKHDEAIAAYREAIRLNPDFAWAHNNLRAILCDIKHDYPAAEAAFRETIRVQPDDVTAHANLGMTLRKQGKVDAAVAEFRAAIRLKLDDARNHSLLGEALTDQGKLDEAIDEWRIVIRLDPNYADAHWQLARALRAQGDFAGALAVFRKGHELGSKQPGWRYPSAKWVLEAERQVAMAQRLSVVFKGEDPPKDNAERLALAQKFETTKRFAAAARVTAEALKSDPRLGDDLQARHRHHATEYAALAGSGQGMDDPRPDEAERNLFRTQARDWFRADLALCSKIVDSGNAEDRDVVVQALHHWKECSDIAPVRDLGALAKLPEAERKEWQALWGDVDTLLNRAHGQTPATP